MLYQAQPETRLGSAVTTAELIYHNTVRSVRKTHSNALLSILINILQTSIIVLTFYILFAVLGMRSAAVRGDFLLYLLSGVFLYMVHTRTVNAVVGSEGPASAIMKHVPMNTAIAISSAALGTLYIQLISMGTVLYVYHLGWGPIAIDDPAGALAMVLLAWFFGVAVGMVLLALKPWLPNTVNVLTTVYTRASMISSGKMFVANSLPGAMLAFFDWNPLFHAIDQARGFTFINYNPHNTSTAYPLYVSVIVLTIGLMGEFYTRRHASLSWNARL